MPAVEPTRPSADQDESMSEGDDDTDLHVDDSALNSTLDETLNSTPNHETDDDDVE